jgi:ABC-type transport system involved in multi-copper enzyme maturation permease subunit
MNPLVKKEIRLLLPAWIGAMLLAIVPAWVAGTVCNLNDFNSRWLMDFLVRAGIPVIFALGILLLGLSSFGQEFSQGTFTVLLSQPVERSRIWWTKIVVLSIAFLTVWLTATISISCQFYLHDYFPYNQPVHSTEFEEFDYAVGFLTLSVLAVFSGGLWTTLLLRQVTNAFWFTLLTPLAIILGICSLFSDRLDSDQSINTVIIVALAVYSVAGFLAAAILFRRCQDIQVGSGEVSLSWFKKFAGPGTAARVRTISFRPRSRFSALCRKEFQLHQVNILIAALILLLHLASLITRHFHPRFNNPDIQFVLETFWLFWLLMPILIGCSAIADERRLGIMESQLSLPVSRRVQLFLKFSIGLVLSLFLGAAFPLLLEGTKELNYWLFMIAAGLFFVSFYASSLARTVLQAMGLAIVVGVALFFGETITVINVFGSLFQHHYFEYQFGFDLLKTFLGFPILLVVLIWLIFWNCKQLRQNTSLLRVNFFSLIAAFAAIYLLSFGIYFRAWEYVTPTLPLRGFMRLSPATEVKLAGSSGAIYAVLPDGRLWAKTYTFVPLFQSPFAASARGAQFFTGTNWAQTSVDNFQAVGIRSDGTLWSIQRNWNPQNRRRQMGPSKLTQIGSDTNWSQVTESHIGFLLLKKDGSLWVWGTNGLDWTRDWDRFQKSLTNKLKSDLSETPTRLGDETNWIRLCSSDLSACAMNNNGDVWSWLAWIGTNNVSRLTREYAANGPWSSFTPDWNTPYVRITTNGELLVMPHFKTTAGDAEWADGRFFPLSRQKWKSAGFSWNNLIAIRDDGTLWEWKALSGNLASPTDPLGRNPVQLGSHSDWIALSPGGLALAADGSLWAWDQPGVPWLAPSRKPTYMGNIFEAAPASP